MKKIVTGADKTKENIERLNYIIKEIKARIEQDTTVLVSCVPGSAAYIVNESEIKRTKEHLSFMEAQLKDEELAHEKYLKNNKPYYEPDTYEYFHNEFKELSYSELQSSFVSNVVSVVESDYKKNKLRSIQNLVKAFNIRDKELTKELNDRVNSRRKEE
jgi:protein-tyrosine phosphatase